MRVNAAAADSIGPRCVSALRSWFQCWGIAVDVTLNKTQMFL